MKKLIFLLLAASFSAGLSAQKTDLRYNLTKGKEYYINQTTVTVMTQNVMGQVLELLEAAFFRP